MLKKHMAACFIATAFIAAPVLAQTTPPPPSSGPAAAGTSAGTPGTPTTQSGNGGSQGRFMTERQPNQMMASSFIGTAVVSSNNESIGDVNDVIMDHNGQALAVIIGVGGFLGIGEKDVAVPFQSLDFNAQPQMTSSNTTGAGGVNAPATTGSTTGTTRTTDANASDNNGGVPDRIVLKMTKAELQAAPAFQFSSRTSNRSNTAPRP